MASVDKVGSPSGASAEVKAAQQQETERARREQVQAKPAESNEDAVVSKVSQPREEIRDPKVAQDLAASFKGRLTEKDIDTQQVRPDRTQELLA